MVALRRIVPMNVFMRFPPLGRVNKAIPMPRPLITAGSTVVTNCSPSNAKRDSIIG
jgi:hypothetical protein